MTDAARDGIVVRGGVGGAAVNLGELGELAGVLGLVARLAAAAAGAAAGGIPLLASGADLLPQEGRQALEALEVAVSSAQELAGAAEDLAAQVRRSRAEYETAEGAAAGLLRRLLAGSPVPAALGLLAPVPRALAHPDVLARPLGWAMGALPWSTPAVLVSAEGDAWQPAAVPAGVEDLLDGIDSLYPAEGGSPGTVEVRRIVHGGEDVSYVVLVPGTQTLTPGGVNPMDNATNVQEFGGAPSAVGGAVLAALVAAGVRSRDPVLLAGHSQGGIAAVRLAADPAVRRSYRIAAVLTAGSPVGHVPSPPGVPVLHLEHTRDAVHMIDGRPNPDRADRVTVVGDHRVTGAAGGGAHDASSYARTGAVVDRSSDPSLVAWHAAAGLVLGGAGARARATSTVYRAQRR